MDIISISCFVKMNSMWEFFRSTKGRLLPAGRWYFGCWYEACKVRRYVSLCTGSRMRCHMVDLLLRA